MTPSIGFVLVTYNRPAQTLRLCQRLNTLFGQPPIAIHHDFSQTDLDRSTFPSNVRFVEDWHETRWASMTVIDAQLSALRLLQETDDPDWFISLSSFDYPIQGAEQIREELADSRWDVYLDIHQVRDLGLPHMNRGMGELAFRNPRYVQLAYNRYVALRLLKPLADRLNRPHEAWVLRSAWLARTLTPFRDNLHCFAGDYWFTANRRTVKLFLERTPLWQTLHKHFTNRFAPEEAFYHTLLGNTPGVSVCPDNLRYSDWRGCHAHPRVLDRSDFPALLQSSKHFARKFPDDPALMAEFDAALQQRENMPQDNASVSQDRPERPFHRPPPLRAAASTPNLMSAFPELKGSTRS